MALINDSQVNEQTYEKDFDTVASQPHQGHPTPVKQPMHIEWYGPLDCAGREGGVGTTFTAPFVGDNVREHIDDVIVMCTEDLDVAAELVVGIVAVAPAPAIADADYIVGDEAGGTGSTTLPVTLDQGEILSFTNGTLGLRTTAGTIGGDDVNQIVEGPALLTATVTPGQGALTGLVYIGIRKHVYGNVASADRAHKYPALTNEDGTTLL